jgi:hypothetical protein
MTWARRWMETPDVVRANTMADFLGAAVMHNESWDAVWQDLMALHGFRPYTLEAT